MFSSKKNFSDVRGKIIFALILYLALFGIYKTYLINDIHHENLELKSFVKAKEIEKIGQIDTKLFDKNFNNYEFCGWKISPPIQNNSETEIKIEKNSKLFNKKSKDNKIIKHDINLEKNPLKLEICITKEDRTNLIAKIISFIIIIFTIALLVKQNNNEPKE